MSTDKLAELKTDFQSTSTQQPFNFNDVKNSLENVSNRKTFGENHYYPDDDDNDSDNSSTTPETEIINTNTLFRMITRFTRVFKNMRYSSQVRFATHRQKEPLLGFILSNITGHASAQIQDKTVSLWSELKQILQQLFSEKKTESQLMEELNTLRQNRDEKVVQFYNRVQSLLTRILNTFSGMRSAERRYRSEMIRDIALNRFVLHTKEEISHILRLRSPENLSDALDFALNEERILVERKSNYRNQNPIKCSSCKKPGHKYRDCYKLKENNFTRNKYPDPKKIQISKSYGQKKAIPQNKFCNYCKKQGHLINECRKREYNNRKQNQNSNENNRRASNHNDISNVHLNSQMSAVSVQQVDNL
ncbi:hypothetical protein TcasGA2_TC014852 [Tribolium castaneum]|uniref:CCHC-type domain-containing protein n=1 Tax=Tribolium castaneum TaxID=7070 RepID=D2A4D0_TRICA|nr:hypothetical protein TcasGA2_TC014852 [Tribolium castaneum]